MAERERLVYIERGTRVRVVQLWKSAEAAQRECRSLEMRGHELVECVPERRSTSSHLSDHASYPSCN